MLSKLGLLIAKKKIFRNRVPSGPGGGTVNYVTRVAIEYIKDIETREEGGTPNILGSIRAGLVFTLKHTVGHELIIERETELVNKFIERFRDSQTLLILGPLNVDRLAIFSFLVHVPLIGKYLHHNFVCSLLNDLFGIQVRSGCSCAGPYVLSFSRQISLVNSCSSSTDNPFHQARAISEKMSEHVYKYLDSVVDAPLAIPKKYEDLIWFIQPKGIPLYRT
ncbi:unnamed protein product [Rotaria sp. Silwood1]|nr:unnamed protein product [Rotaria sp. Silwood1]